jgi:UDP-N-acetyl-alpha-D-quinovosamine dehydrogenase
MTQLMTNVLVTGASGFVGRALCQALSQSGHEVRAALRTDNSQARHAAGQVVVGDICSSTDWTAALRGVEAVVHLAARVHQFGNTSGVSDLYMQTNVHGTRRLALAAARAGVRRLVFLSTVKVNGEDSGPHAFTAQDVPNPQDPYSTSKLLAEQALREVAWETGLEVVVVRPALVYGPGVRANFLRLMQWVDRGLPLPLGRVANRRSLVSLWNLCDLLVHVLQSASAPGRTWMVSDGEDLSTPQLIRRIGAAMGRTVTFLPVPVGVFVALAGAVGRRAEAARLCGSLVVDSSATCRELQWAPPLCLDDGIARTVEWYLSEGRA